MPPALYSPAATASQYAKSNTVAAKGSSGNSSSAGIAFTAWLATLMHAIATCAALKRRSGHATGGGQGWQQC